MHVVSCRADHVARTPMPRGLKWRFLPCGRYIYDIVNATGGYGEGRTDFSESYYGGSNNATLGALADSEWLYVHPDGMRRLLAYVSTRHASSHSFLRSSCAVSLWPAAQLQLALCAPERHAAAAGICE